MATSGLENAIFKTSLQSIVPQSRQSHRGRGMLGSDNATARKRSASSDLPGELRHRTVASAKHYAKHSAKPEGCYPAMIEKRDRSYQADHTGHVLPTPISIGSPRSQMRDHKPQLRPFVQDHDRPKKTAIRRDCGYANASAEIDTITPDEGYQHNPVQHHRGVIQLPAHGRYPCLILQPDSSPISQDQLAAEVKGIYAGLVMVEAKCINIDAAQAKDHKQTLGPEQWQALIALHRTLLYEHHDFLMATQQPFATSALRGLATKYSMLARMWKHGVHSFLEVLRRRRPESQEYMLAFIYLAYQMMALLFETVPSFTDTWIECLGDLARYRMAIEEEKESHATWGSVAACWYTLASDRHSAIGRLYHHLSSLESPSLCTPWLYVRSLSCFIPFTNARDSLVTLCPPIVQDGMAIPNHTGSPEARALTIHALVSARYDLIAQLKRGTLKLLDGLVRLTCTLRNFGPYLAIAAFFGMPSMAVAAPISDLGSLRTSSFETTVGQQINRWLYVLEHFGVPISIGAVGFVTFINITRLTLNKPTQLPKDSGNLAIGFGLTSWVVIEMGPSSSTWKILMLMLWFCAESNYVAKMCWLTTRGRVYFWTTVCFGLFAAMFMAALQSDTRPTLHTMILGGLPTAPLFTSCAARLLPKAVGLGPRATS